MKARLIITVDYDVNESFYNDHSEKEMIKKEQEYFEEPDSIGSIEDILGSNYYTVSVVSVPERK